MVETNYSLADIGAVTRGNDGFGMGNGSWWAILVLFALFGGWGNGFGGNNGIAQDYVLSSDMSMLSRQMSDGFGSQERKLDSISNGICSLGYDQLAQMNGINMNIMQNGYESRLATQTLGTQMGNCCCDLKGEVKDNRVQSIINTNGLQQQIDRCCCDNERATMETRFIMQQNQCDTLSAIDKLGDRIERRMTDSQIQQLRDENFFYKLKSTQSCNCCGC